MPQLSFKKKSLDKERSPDINNYEFNFSCPFGRLLLISPIPSWVVYT